MAARTPPAAQRSMCRHPPGTPGDSPGAPSAAPPSAASSHWGQPLSRRLPRCLTARIYTATVAQVQRLVDGLDGETALAGANGIAPDDVPSFETWAQPERPG